MERFLYESDSGGTVSRVKRDGRAVVEAIAFSTAQEEEETILWLWDIDVHQNGKAIVWVIASMSILERWKGGCVDLTLAVSKLNRYGNAVVWAIAVSANSQGDDETIPWAKLTLKSTKKSLRGIMWWL
jgi:hypothetical protein